ncbi:hypothetical protein [Agrococcus sp. Marseille-Q4369]|uniref:hypothetical protein n=1 Tax=Agrococcus sp. Marseille-Q4369 TaxID=2810513 RepID=UPI001B8C5F2B|nr:hypothetical protein [Agrococcus sp. Marseille-Q4369]QUW20251.1 hypothetical protein JSQ78_04490 [Agrococcus sp. Marseille-Q4369]
MAFVVRDSSATIVRPRKLRRKEHCGSRIGRLRSGGTHEFDDRKDMRSLARLTAVLTIVAGFIGGVSQAPGPQQLDVADDSGIVAPNIFLDPWETLQCRKGNTGFTVHDYYDFYQQEYVSLRCGSHNDSTSTGSGWVHIEARHYEDWQALLDRCRAENGCFDPTVHWDDVMNLSIQAALEAQLQVVPRASNQTACYATEVWLNSDPIVVYYPAIVLSTNRGGSADDPQNIITAYFSTSDSTPC